MTDDPDLRDYLTHTVGGPASTIITSARRYETWGELPWTSPPDPMPEGAAVMIGVRSHLDYVLGQEVFIVMPEDDKEVLARRLAEKLLRARSVAGRN